MRISLPYLELAHKVGILVPAAFDFFHVKDLVLIARNIFQGNCVASQGKAG